MKLFRYNRVVASIALVSYLLASTLSGIMHDHGEGASCCDTAAQDCANRQHEACPHHHHHHHDGSSTDTGNRKSARGPVVAGTAESRGLQAHNADCAACQFLSQLSVPVALVSNAPSSDTPSPLAWVPAAMISAEALHAFDARGPPATV